MKYIFYVIGVLMLIWLLGLPSENLSDRDSYVANIDNSIMVLIGKWTGFNLPILLSEPLYDTITALLFLIFGDGYRALPYLISTSFILFFLSFGKTMRNDGNFEMLFFALLVIAMPLVLKNYIIHLRQGLAMAIFFYFYSGRTYFRKYLLFLPALVHGTFLVISPLIFFYENFPKLRLYSLACIPLLLSIFLGTGYEAFSGINEKIDSIDLYDNVTSGLSFIYFSLILLFLSFGKFLENIKGLFIFFLTLYLSTYFVQASFSARIFESALPLVFFEYRDNTFKRRILSLSFCLYILIQFIRNPNFNF